MMLYHGSTIEIRKPNIAYSRDRLDFGRGFYLTDRKEQAVSWAGRYKKNGLPGVVNIYELPFDEIKENFAVKEFQEYNKEWLDYIIANRQMLIKNNRYDVVTGGIANDKVFTTVELYEEGLITESEALGRLKYNKPNWQMCIGSQKILDNYLTFRESEEL